MRKLGLFLSLLPVAHAGDDPQASVLRVYDIADMAQVDASLAAAVTRAKAAAEGNQVRLEKHTLVVVAPAAVQEKVAKELAAVRDACGMLVRMELRVVKVEGGLQAASIPADRLDAILKEKGAKVTNGPNLVCFDGQWGSLSVTRQISYVSDFDICVDEQGNVTADPEVSTIAAGLSAKLRPLASGQTIRAAVEVSVTEVAEPIPEVELPVPVPTPLKVQVPACTTRSVSRLVECAAGAFTVIDVGGGDVVLLRVTLIPAKGAGELLGQPIGLEDAQPKPKEQQPQEKAAPPDRK